MLTIVGHGLVKAGKAYAGRGCHRAVCLATRTGDPVVLMDDDGCRQGHGVCQCGAQSQHLRSNRERQDWHRVHKETLVDDLTRSA